VSELRPGVPPKLDDVLTRAMAKNPDERAPTATAVMDELARALDGAQLAPPPIPDEQKKTSSTGDGPSQRTATAGFGTPVPPTAGATVIDRPPDAADVGPRPAPPRSKRPLYIAVIAVVIAIAAAAGAGLALTGDDKPKVDPVAVAHRGYVQDVDKVVGGLGDQQKALHTKLEDPASAQRDQLEAAEGLRELYSTTAAALQKIGPPKADAAKHAALLQGVNAAQAQYTALAKSVENSSSVGFDIAFDEAAKAEKAINDALQIIYGSKQ
jgi:hypothetical protein